MAKTSTYLNFSKGSEEVFEFYKSVFGGDYLGDGIMRFGDIPPSEGFPPMDEETKNLVMHVGLEITGGHILMGSDSPQNFGEPVIMGSNVSMSLQPDTLEETKRLFKALSKGGKITMELEKQFWGSIFGTCTDKFGISWMFDYPIEGQE